MKKLILLAAAAAMTLGGCASDKIKNKGVYKRSTKGLTMPSIAERTGVAAQTCDAQYLGERQNYLSAVETVLSFGASAPDANRAPLERFRAEVNAAYNNVVSRCKTHVHCLEVKFYDEAGCYVSATEYREAERRFESLAVRLREIERDYDAIVARMKKKKKKGGPPPVSVIVDNYVDVDADQSQTNDQQVGDNVEDQDVLVLCNSQRGLLDRRCRQPCGQNPC